MAFRLCTCNFSLIVHMNSSVICFTRFVYLHIIPLFSWFIHFWKFIHDSYFTNGFLTQVIYLNLINLFSYFTLFTINLFLHKIFPHHSDHKVIYSHSISFFSHVIFLHIIYIKFSTDLFIFIWLIYLHFNHKTFLTRHLFTLFCSSYLLLLFS